MSASTNPLPSSASSNLVIPARYRPGLVALLSVSSTTFDELYAALNRAPECTGHKELATWVSPEVKSVSSADVTKIIDTLTSLYRVRIRTERPIEVLARDIVSAMRETTPAVPQISEADAASFVERLSKLLSLKSLNVVETKALELKGEYDRTFCEANIFTDLRPVFRDRPEEAPAGMLLVYTLKLGYHDSHENRHREFHLSLDSSDLTALKKAIERAESKAKTLKNQLESAKIKAIELE